MDSFQTAISAHLHIAEANAEESATGEVRSHGGLSIAESPGDAGESAHALDATEGWILVAAGAHPCPRLASVCSVIFALSVVNWTDLRLLGRFQEWAAGLGPVLAMMAFVVHPKLPPWAPFVPGLVLVGFLYPTLVIGVVDAGVATPLQFVGAPAVIVWELVIATVATTCCRPGVDTIGLGLAVVFPGYIVTTTILSVTMVYWQNLQCGGPNAGRATATIIACMATSSALNGISCLLHLAFARQVRAAVPTRTHLIYQTKQSTWRILAAACLLTLVAYVGLEIGMIVGKAMSLPFWEAFKSILANFGVWLIHSWLVILPHLATCILLQADLEHVAALVRSAEVVGDLTAAFQACQDCKRRFGWFLACHFVLDGLSLLTSLAADAILLLRRPACSDGDPYSFDSVDALLLNLGLNHPQLTAGFLFMQFVSLVAFHEAVEDTVNRYRESPNGQAMFQTLELRRSELQVRVMGKVFTRRWFGRAVLSSMLSTVVSTAGNFVKGLLFNKNAAKLP